MLMYRENYRGTTVRPFLNLKMLIFGIFFTFLRFCRFIGSLSKRVFQNIHYLEGLLYLFMSFHEGSFQRQYTWITKTMPS